MLPKATLYNRQTLIVILIGILVLSITGCSKRETVSISHADVNFLIRKDNPGDPVDHALYNFYTQTGIAGFYNDTVYIKVISREVESEIRYQYIRLSFTFTLQGAVATGYKYLSNLALIPPFLTFFESKVLPSCPSNDIIPSLFLIDSFSVFYNHAVKRLDHGFTALYGFNTLGVVVKEVNNMSDSVQVVYRASLLAGIAEKMLLKYHAQELQASFFQVTRALAKNISPLPFYQFLPYDYMSLTKPLPPAEELGLLYHPLVPFRTAQLIGVPSESIDLRAFLTAAFLYNEGDFSEKYASYPEVIQKFLVVKSLLLTEKFILP